MISRRFQLLGTGAALLCYAGVLFLADFAFGISPLTNPLSVAVLLLRVGTVVYAAPNAVQSSRAPTVLLAVVIAGMLWAVLVDDFVPATEAKAALMLPWWLVFLLTSVWAEVNDRPSFRHSLLVLALAVPLSLGFLALMYVASVWTE